jgi:hypothetical protein
MAEVDYTEPAQKTSLILTTFGVAGPSTLVGDTLNIPIYAAGITGADEGLTLNGSLVELGYPGVGPAAGLFTEDRIIGLGTWDLGFYNGVCNFLIEDPTQAPMGFPTDSGAPAGHQIIRVDFFNTVSDDVPWRLTTFESDNGDGTFDHVMIQGFNHSHSDDPALPGWFDSIEYHYLHDFYERHIQFQAYASEVRLMSYTYTFSGVDFASDVCLLFFSSTSFAFRNLNVPNQFEYIFGTPGTDLIVGQFGNQVENHLVPGTVYGGYIEKINMPLAKVSLQNTGPATDYEFLGWRNVYFSSIGPHAIFATEADFSFTADKIWVSNPASNALSFDNASSLDLQINFQPSRNSYHMKVSTATSEWGDYIPNPNGYLRTFYATDGITDTLMLSLAAFPALSAIFPGYVKTGKPAGGVSVASDWRIGSQVNAVVVLDTTRYLEVDIEGVIVKLAIVN